jgi:hypothetical protein
MPAEQQSLQPFENGSSEDVIPTKEEARHALAIAIQGLEIHAKGLNENEYLFFQKLGCYLDISSVN